MPDTEEDLLKRFRQLPGTQQQALLDYAEFLNQRYAIVAEPVAEHPLDIPRPQQESVVKAVRRLSKTYPMLDSKELFEKTSSFMMRNLMHGEDSGALIDEMELFFQQSYQTHISVVDDK
ncbi:MAG: hypothetical protein ACN4GR_09740 [Arenicellales bacterium]